MASVVTVQKYADPTLETVLGLDEDRYVVVKNVPIFRSHTRVAKGLDGEPETKVVVRDEDLYKLAEQVNKQFVEDGLPLVVTIGHRQQSDPNFPEEKQPRVVGFAKDARVGQFGPGGKLALLVDMYIRSDCWDEAKRHPFRSVDFYPQSGKISGVALLTRDAFLPLGAISYQASGVKSIRYEAPSGGLVIGGVKYMPGQRVPSSAALRYSMDVSRRGSGRGLVCYELDNDRGDGDRGSFMNDREPLKYRRSSRRHLSLVGLDEVSRLKLALDAYRNFIGSLAYCACDGGGSLVMDFVDDDDGDGDDGGCVDVEVYDDEVDDSEGGSQFDLRISGRLASGSVFDLIRMVLDSARS